MKRMFVRFSQALLRQVLMVGMMLLLSLSGGLLWLQQPSYASAAVSNSLTPEEKVDRAYEIGVGTGMQEEEYQRRLQSGEDPTKMSKPYRRILEADKEAVPKTSALEAKINKVRNLADQVTGKN